MVGRAPPAGKTLHLERDDLGIPTEAELPSDWSIFKAGIVVLSPCSITRKRFRIVFSSSQSLKLGNKIVSADNQYWNSDTPADFLWFFNRHVCVAQFYEQV